MTTLSRVQRHSLTLGASARARTLIHGIPLTSVATAPLAWGAATFPSYLPHQPMALGVLLAIAWLAARAIVARAATGVRRVRGNRSLAGPTRELALGALGALTVLVVCGSLAVQNSMRDRIGMAQLSIRDLVVAGLVGAALVGCVRLLAWVWRQKARWWRPAGALLTVGVLCSATYPAAASAPPVASPAASLAEQVLMQPSRAGAVRTYVSLVDEPDVDRRASRSVRRLTDGGGLSRSRVVIVLPTGSGWVDPHLVTGLERRFGRDVATVSMQYDDRPSWQAYAFGQDRAERAARAVFEAVIGAVEGLPKGKRPQVHVVGESLGATAGQSIFRGPGGPAARQRVCSVLWVGTPGGTGVGMANETLVANPDDPIVHARPSMVFMPPGDGRPWLPVVSAVQAMTDFVGSLAVPTGAGHRYGPDQADRLRTC